MKILVSKCLLGHNCKYDGKNNLCPDLVQMLKEHEVYAICPEVDGGLPTPRVPSEIVNGKVINQEGSDVTTFYVNGANVALKICLDNDIKYAILKAKSPSCGCGQIYDGTFSHHITSGDGITSKTLLKHGIKVYNETNYHQLLR